VYSTYDDGERDADRFINERAANVRRIVTQAQIPLVASRHAI